jgi:hypothetical protein
MNADVGRAFRVSTVIRQAREERRNAGAPSE